ncbi:hypothetical protein AXFE_02970 [Acidithrix ferrooxidans]|uniref:Uncharacterized protein n=1 Tax=Acidithrix ferrooxidans TaxID=1280514 RepID=A0A0D8HNU1_9ACTN|nr:hypothetical protein AXFE_02970 [Acidithrix ferrooxidans]
MVAISWAAPIGQGIELSIGPFTLALTKIATILKAITRWFSERFS